MSESFCCIYNAALRAAAHTFRTRTFNILQILLSYTDASGVVSVSQHRIAQDAGCSSALVHRAIPDLIEAGCITYRRHGGYNFITKRKLCNIYQVNPDLLHIRPYLENAARRDWKTHNGQPLNLIFKGEPFPPRSQPEPAEADHVYTEVNVPADLVYSERDMPAAAAQSAAPDHVYTEVNVPADLVYTEGNMAAPTLFTPSENQANTLFTPSPTGSENPQNLVYSGVNMLAPDSIILPSDPPDTLFTLDETCSQPDSPDLVYSRVNDSRFKNLVVVVVQKQEEPPQQSFVVSGLTHDSKTLKASWNEKTSDDGLTPALPATTPQQPDLTVQSDSAQSKPAGTPTFQEKTADDGRTPALSTTTPQQPNDTVQSDSAQSKQANTPAFQDQVPPDSYQNVNSGDNSGVNTQASAEDEDGEWVSPPPPPFIPKPADPENPPRPRRAYADFAAINTPLPDPDDEALARTLQQTTYMLMSRARGLVAHYGRASVAAGRGYMANIQDQITHPAGYLIWLLGSGQIHPVEDAPLTQPANPYVQGKYADFIES